MNFVISWLIVSSLEDPSSFDFFHTFTWVFFSSFLFAFPLKNHTLLDNFCSVQKQVTQVACMLEQVMLVLNNDCAEVH